MLHLKFVTFILLGIFVIISFALAQEPTSNNQDQYQQQLNSQQNQYQNQYQREPQETPPSLLPAEPQQETAPSQEKPSPTKETSPQVLPQETSLETQLSENAADQKAARQSNQFSYIIYFVSIMAIIGWIIKKLFGKAARKALPESELGGGHTICPKCKGAVYSDMISCGCGYLSHDNKKIETDPKDPAKKIYYCWVKGCPGHPGAGSCKLVYHCDSLTCPGHSSPAHRCKTGVWKCGSLTCPGHSSPAHRCKTGVWKCGSLTCPGHSSPSHKCK